MYVCAPRPGHFFVCGSEFLAWRLTNTLCSSVFKQATVSLLDHFLGKLADGVRSSLSVNHNLEAFEVVKFGAGFALSKSSGSGGGFPLLFQTELRSGLNEGGGTGTAGQRNSQAGESESSHGVGDAGEVRSIHKHGVLVGDVSDDAHLSEVGSVVHVGNSARFNKLSVALQNRQSKHRKEVRNDTLIR